MQLQQAVNNVFVQLAETLNQLSQQEYAQPCKTLFNNTIGQHVRHIIELFQCLENGYETGVVNYEKRKRDKAIETDKAFASGLLRDIYAGLEKSDKALTLEATYDDHSADPIRISTNFHREIAYNLEHTIHHMALIRVGINEVSAIRLPEDFGVATSTVKHRKQCAQ
ncbi:MAG: DinB family protein [Chitinophagaceae bacterium]|nr:MAG: DinB family protein [Chitinophagaceae bacterium]